MFKYFSILRINWVHSLEYRANALIGLFAVLSGLFIEYQIWSLIFDSNNYSMISMAGGEKGYSFEQLMIFIFLSPQSIFGNYSDLVDLYVDLKLFQFFFY